MSATPPSIAIAAPVLGGPEVVRVVLNSSSSSHSECFTKGGRGGIYIWAQGARAGDPLFLSVEQQGRLEYGL